jgi:hypothetical protein
MKIISFDIGVYNLAFATLDVPSQDAPPSLSECAPAGLSLRTSIVDWGILCLKEKKETCDFNTLSKTLVRMLYEKFAEEDTDVVLIENQPCMKNPTMKSIQMIVYSFFLMKAHMESKDIDIKLVSASNKLKVKHKADLTHITTTSKYAQNKQQVVAHVRNYLQLTQSINAEWIERFAKVKKADDWADAYAQALHYIENTLS